MRLGVHEDAVAEIRELVAHIEQDRGHLGQILRRLLEHDVSRAHLRAAVSALAHVLRLEVGETAPRVLVGRWGMERGGGAFVAVESAGIVRVHPIAAADLDDLGLRFEAASMVEAEVEHWIGEVVPDLAHDAIGMGLDRDALRAALIRAVRG